MWYGGKPRKNAAKVPVGIRNECQSSPENSDLSPSDAHQTYPHPWPRSPTDSLMLQTASGIILCYFSSVSGGRMPVIVLAGPNRVDKIDRIH